MREGPNLHEFGLRIPRNLSAVKSFVDGRFRLRSAEISRPSGVNTPDAEWNIGAAARIDSLHNAESDQIGICQKHDRLSMFMAV